MIYPKIEERNLIFDPKKTDFIYNTTDRDIVSQVLSEHLSFMQTTYTLNRKEGIPWLDYLGKTNDVDRTNLMITYIYNKLLNYDGIIPASISVEHIENKDRVSYFHATAQYKKGGITTYLDIPLAFDFLVGF